MRIELRSPWYAPSGSLLRKGQHEVPDEWEKQLPSGAKKLEEEKPAPKQEKLDLGKK